MKYKIKPKKWLHKAVELREKGYRSKAISKEIGIPDRTVRYQLAKYYDNLSDIATASGTVSAEVTATTSPSGANILYYDIETTLAKSYHWGHWKQNISAKQKLVPSHLLAHAWAWGDGEVVGSVLTPKEVLDRNPERLVLEAWALFDNCDILVAHNGKSFDVKKMNAFFLSYGLPPPSPFKVIDTLHIAKRKFGLDFNSLDFIAKYLQVTNKIVNGGVDLWIGCDRGDPESLRLMLEYNFGDIVTLREVHKKLIAWDNDGVNMALYTECSDGLCPHCGSDNITELSAKFTYTVAKRYTTHRCNACKAVVRRNGGKYYRVI